jgi:hypothetical protein
VLETSNYADPDITLSVMISGIKSYSFRFKKDQMLFLIFKRWRYPGRKPTCMVFLACIQADKKVFPLCLMKGIGEAPVLGDEGACRHGTVGHGIQNLEDRL